MHVVRNLLVSILLFHHCLAFSQDISKVSRYYSGSKQGVTFYGKPFSYTWQYSEYDGRNIPQWVGGDSLEPPRYVVRDLTLEISGQNVLIPKSAYHDIYDPGVYSYGPYVMEDNSNIYLIINASDGAGSAEIWLKFDGNIYVGREIK